MSAAFWQRSWLSFSVDRSGQKTKKKLRWAMKFRTMVRMQMILMGLGAALLLVSSAHAQQDMDPAFFPDGGNVEPFRQPAAVTVNNAITIDLANAATAPQAISKASTQVGSVAMWTTANVWGISLLVISMTLVTLYSLARAKRQRAERRSA
jgi:hypothetical protein